MVKLTATLRLFGKNLGADLKDAFFSLSFCIHSIRKEMTELYQRIFVQAPYNLARVYLNEALRESVESHTSMTLTLELPLREGGAGISREVIATYARGTDAMHFDEPWKVHWTPKGGGPYPDFDGELTVRADEDYVTSILELRGDYKPPGGAAGRAFDAVLGSRIASATARELLNTIARSIENRYRREEAAKHGNAVD